MQPFSSDLKTKSLSLALRPASAGESGAFRWLLYASVLAAMMPFPAAGRGSACGCPTVYFRYFCSSAHTPSLHPQCFCTLSLFFRLCTFYIFIWNIPYDFLFFFFSLNRQLYTFNLAFSTFENLSQSYLSLANMSSTEEAGCLFLLSSQLKSNLKMKLKKI